MLKKFNSYIIGKSTDHTYFHKKVIFASSNKECNVFKVITEENELYSESIETPVIVWDNFKFTPKIINENRFSLYNIVNIPTLNEVYTSFDLECIPKSTTNRHEIKNLKFPIIASSYLNEKEFKTYDSFKKSEDSFSIFREKPKSDSTFNIIIFNNNPIHIEESINGIGFDVNIPRFKYLSTVEKITETLSQKYIFDIYKLILTESNGKVYLTGLNRSGELNISQKIKIYEAVYEFHYHRKLPNFYKNKVFKNKLDEYYRKSFFNSKLLKPRYSINFDKYK